MTEHLNVLLTPIWSARLTPDEQWNLRTTVESSPESMHVFLAPDDLDVAFYTQHFPASRIDRFPSRNFRGIRSYSRFMLDPSLYERYRTYEYVTIVQTDAVLLRSISDVLAAAEFDYAGAPWEIPFEVSLPSLIEPHFMFHLQSRFLLARRLDVGNGGLSVRRTAAMIRSLPRYHHVQRFIRLNEDLFLSYLGALGLIRVATRGEASLLFYERDRTVPPESAPARGFHALERYHPDFHAALQQRTASDARG